MTAPFTRDLNNPSVTCGDSSLYKGAFGGRQKSDFGAAYRANIEHIAGSLAENALHYALVIL